MKSGLRIIMTWRNFNSIKKLYPMTGKKHGAFTTDLDVVAMKTFCKANSCTVNDYTTALISNTLYEYFDKNRVVDGVEYYEKFSSNKILRLW